MTLDTLVQAVASFSALVPALLLHEVAHGWMAWKCGDPTARDEGRLSLNPLRHVDPFMSIILPALLALSGSRVLFGGAKPVPISLWHCRNPRRAYWMIAAAGPAANLLQAMLGAGLFWLLEFLCGCAARADAAGLWWLFGSLVSEPLDPLGLESELYFVEAGWTIVVAMWLVCYVSTNVALMLFNLIPIPPLDGSRIMTVLLPKRLAVPYARLENIGLLLVFGLLYLPQTGHWLSLGMDFIVNLLLFRTLP